jgi:hypothetical protein
LGSDSGKAEARVEVEYETEGVNRTRIFYGCHNSGRGRLLKKTANEAATNHHFKGG